MCKFTRIPFSFCTSISRSTTIIKLTFLPSPARRIGSLDAGKFFQGNLFLLTHRVLPNIRISYFLQRKDETIPKTKFIEGLNLLYFFSFVFFSVLCEAAGSTRKSNHSSCPQEPPIVSNEKRSPRQGTLFFVLFLVVISIFQHSIQYVLIFLLFL